MQLGFDTDEVIHANAATLLYALYKSRDKNSSLTGVDTWNRCQSYIRAAVIKSETMPEFIQNFSKKAGIQSIKPIFIDKDGLIKIGKDLVKIEGVYNYHIDIFTNSEILDCFAKESLYIIMLVRERLQREKEGFDIEDKL